MATVTNTKWRRFQALHSLGWSFWLQLAAFAAFVVWAAVRALTAGLLLPTDHMDGAFQTASGLFRLDAGQVPGRDFFPYLGIGPLVLLFPVFRVAGANLAASVFAAHVSTLLLGALSAAVLWHLVFRPRSVLTSLAGGACLFALPFVAASLLAWPLPAAFAYAGVPGNSLRPVRAALPYLVVAIYVAGILRVNGSALRQGLSGVLAGAMLLWSNDFALPTFGLFVMLVVLGGRQMGELRARNAGLFFLCAAFTVIGLLGFATLGHPWAMLEYNFLGVARDQWWYFAPYDPEMRFFRLADLTRLVAAESAFPLAVLVLVGLVFAWTRRFEHGLIAWIGLVLFAGGAVASVGGHLGGYFSAFYFWGMLTTLLVIGQTARGTAGKVFGAESRVLSVVQTGVSVLALAALLTATAGAWRQYARAVEHDWNDASRFYVPELGGYLGTGWRDYIELARQAQARQVVEEYWGIWSAVRHSLPPWPVDSVIHALGRTRSDAAAQLRQADMVISTRNWAAWEWQPWNLSQNFWFYEDLLERWDPVASSPTTMVWRKRNSARVARVVDCAPGADGQSLMVDGGAAGFYRVEFDYQFQTDGRALVMVRNNISFAADSRGYVSIDPAGTRRVLPVYVSDAQPARLDVRVIGATDYRLDIRSCSAHRITLVNGDVLHAPGSLNEAFFVTDFNWERGIARHWAGFHVPHTDEYTSRYQTGSFVAFRNGETRRIVRIEQFGAYLNVYVEGDVLNPDAVGLPSGFVVTKPVQQ